jgi:PKD repeat protein
LCNVKISEEATLTIYLTDKSTGAITYGKLVFLDGATPILKSQSQKFIKIEQFKVILTVGNGAGNSSKYQVVTVTK